MSLLDDATSILLGNISVHLVHDPERGATYKCLQCPTRVLFGSDESFVHAPECPTLSRYKILAALEAAERLSVAVQEHLGDRRTPSWQWPELAEPADALANALESGPTKAPETPRLTGTTI